MSYAVKEAIINDWIEMQKKIDKEDPKIVYYMSMEFLMGRALGNNLINMTAYTEVKEALDELGIDLNTVEDEARSGSWKRCDLEDWQTCSLILWHLLAMRLMVVVSVIVTECSSRRSRRISSGKTG